jgi:hypothetical protein
MCILTNNLAPVFLEFYKECIEIARIEFFVASNYYIVFVSCKTKKNMKFFCPYYFYISFNMTVK